MHLFRKEPPALCSRAEIRRPWRRIAGTFCSLALLGAWLAPKVVIACMGSPPQPVCAKTTFLAKTVALVVVGPRVAPVGGIVGIRIIAAGVPTPAGCVPVSTTISVTLACLPPPGGLPPTGSVTIPTPTAGLYPFVISVPIPFPGFKFCTVTGTATTTWADGSTTTATGDTVLCVAEQAPGHPAGTPRLDMTLLSPPVQHAQPGDQRIHRYLLTNNDPVETATLNIQADSQQVSRLPSLLPPPIPGSGSGVYAISDPGTGDNFPIAFAEDLLPMVPRAPNYVLDDLVSENEIGLVGGGSLIWLNQFKAAAGARFIDRIDVFWGTVPNNMPFSVLLYRDPNNDGDPNDAVLLTRADSLTMAHTTTQVKIAPTDVGPVGKKFFVGIVLQNAPNGSFPMALDQTTNAMRSWLAADLACKANVNNLAANSLPPALNGSLGVPGNWLVRAHGIPSPPPPGCVTLPPDPMATAVPVINKPIVLCPGESREILVAMRSWPMCANGSCGEHRMRVTGTFSDGSPTGACLGASYLADTSIPPQFQWPDSGHMGTVFLQGPDGLRIMATMPSHTVNEGVHLGPLTVQTGMSLTQSIQSMLLDPERGRIVAHNVGQGGVAVQVGQTFQVNGILNIFSKDPLLQTTILELHLHNAAPQLQDSYFSVNTHTKLSGPGIPPTLDSFFDVFFNVSLDGVTDGLHRSGRIFPGSINVLPISPTQVQFSFIGFFDPVASLPSIITDLSVVLDPGGTATGVAVPLPPTPCPADIVGNGEGIVNVDDLLLVINSWGACPPPCPPYCAADINRNCVVNVDDLLAVINGWGRCPQ